MQVSIDRLRVEITMIGCDVPADERARFQAALTELAKSVREVPNAALEARIICHAQSKTYRTEFKLTLPGRSLFASDTDPYLDSAWSRSLAKLMRKVEGYREHPDTEALTIAEHITALEQDIVAPEDPDAGPLAAAADAGDYRAFRNGLVLYEDWLRKRVGRLVQRHPDAEALVGQKLRLGDVVEEVYLTAFERFTRRPTEVPLSKWLEELIEPSIRALIRHPDEEAAATSFARTVRESPLVAPQSTAR